MVEHPSCKREVVGSYPTRHGAGPWIFRFISQWTVTSVRLPACMLGWPSSPPTRLIKRSTPSAHTLGAEFAHMWTACTVYSTFTTMCPPPHPTFKNKQFYLTAYYTITWNIHIIYPNNWSPVWRALHPESVFRRPRIWPNAHISARHNLTFQNNITQSLQFNSSPF